MNDPHVQGELSKLNAVPATKLDSVKGEWQSLDQYTAKKAYQAVYGSEELPSSCPRGSTSGPPSSTPCT